MNHKFMKKTRKMLSGIVVMVLIVTMLPMLPVFAKDTADIYPYAMFAVSDEEGAITIHADNFCVNGDIAANGTIVSTGNMNINGIKKENANEEMVYIFDKIDREYFADKKENAYAGFEDVYYNGVIRDTDIPVLFSEAGDIQINSQNVNLNGILYAPYGKVEITAQNLNLNNVIIIADTITINAPSVNVNYHSSAAEYIGGIKEPVIDDIPDMGNIPDLSIDDLEEMNRGDSDFYIDVNEYGYIEQIYGRFSDVSITSAETALYSLYSIKTALGLKNPFEELELYDMDKDESGMIFKYRQMVQGVPCYDNNIIISCDSNGKTDYLLSDYFPVDTDINTAPDISNSEVDDYIHKEYPDANVYDAQEDEQMYIFNYYGKTALVWKKYLCTENAETYEILADAHSGDIIYKNQSYSEATNDIFTIGKDLLGKSRSIMVKEKTHLFEPTEYFLEDRTRNIIVYDAGGDTSWPFYNPPKKIQKTKNVWNAEEISTMANMKKIYDFYLNTFDRISYDDAWWKSTGNPIKVYLNTGIENNAWWDPEVQGILIGVGDTTKEFKSISLAAGNDILCHEFTHAVVENETSLYKIYYGTTGAIDEGYADLFACFFDKDWMVGEDVTIAYCLRDGAEPNKSKNTAAVEDVYFVDYKTVKEDNAGVHTNCTLISHAAYLMYEKGMDRDILQSLWYKSLCLGYSKHSDFYDVRLKVIKAAKKLKLSEDEKKIINKAFDEVNILKSNCDETRKSYFKDLDKKVISKSFLDDGLYLTGKIVEADKDNNVGNNIALSDVSVSVSDIGNMECYALADTDGSGIYHIDMEEKEGYMLTLEKEGYLSENYYVNDIKALQKEIYCDTVELIPSAMDGIGSASGWIESAAFDRPVEGLTLNVRKGINNVYSDIQTTVFTGKSGEYKLESLPAGNYTVEICDNREVSEKDRCLSSYMNIKIIGNTMIKEQNGVVSPALEKNQVRVVLTWGRYPCDLDSHLLSKMPDNAFHVSYEEKEYTNNGKLICRLDKDDRTSYGPETTTLYNPITGTYDFYVHNYSGESALSSSEACVKVYVGGETYPSYTFHVPDKAGAYWDVFTYNSATKTIIPTNTMR